MCWGASLFACVVVTVHFIVYTSSDCILRFQMTYFVAVVVFMQKECICIVAIVAGNLTLIVVLHFYSHSFNLKLILLFLLLVFLPREL